MDLGEVFLEFGGLVDSPRSAEHLAAVGIL